MKKTAILQLDNTEDGGFATIPLIAIRGDKCIKKTSLPIDHFKDLIKRMSNLTLHEELAYTHYVRLRNSVFAYNPNGNGLTFPYKNEGFVKQETNFESVLLDWH